jgi:acetate kinase
VVHGGEAFSSGTLITDEVLSKIETLNPLAPLHNPVNVAGIREMRRLIPNAPHVAVFDTAFHHTLQASAYLYGLPYEVYEHQRVRRYGFHGMSHEYVSLRAAEFLKQRPNRLRLVSCHLGNGASLCAIDHGRSIDTTMGFTPAEGLIMGTRCGDIDSGAIAFLQQNGQLSADQIEVLLNKKSGLLGLSGTSGDMREILKAADQGQARALVTLQAFCYRVRKYIGAYMAALGGVDAIVFTGGIGQGSDAVRAIALQGLSAMGIHLDTDRNREANNLDHPCRVSTDDSPIAVLVVPTDEERMMAREALRTLRRWRLTASSSRHVARPIPVEVSAHHVHLTQAHVEALFGEGQQLTKRTDLSQPGQYACQEQVTLVGSKGRIERVRVLGPTRKYTQVEIAMTEQFKLGSCRRSAKAVTSRIRQAARSRGLPEA